MKKFNFADLIESDLQGLCRRPAIDFAAVVPTVQQILIDVRQKGDAAVRKYESKFGGDISDMLQVTEDEISAACQRVPTDVKDAFRQAAKNIRQFHAAQMQSPPVVETMPGVACFAQMRAIEKVGLYIPGGTAPLPSTGDSGSSRTLQRNRALYA